MIALRDVSKHYGDVKALDGLTIDVAPGEIYGLIGPNGAGKTTTIKLLVGLLKPTSGSILVNGTDIAKDGIAAKRVIGYIPDEPYLYGRLTPSELMDFKGSLHDMTPAHLERGKGELLELVGLADYRNNLIESFSLGMRQRLAIAVSLLPSPRIIVVDADRERQPRCLVVAHREPGRPPEPLVASASPPAVHSAARTSPKCERSALSQAHPVTASVLCLIQPVIRPGDPLFIGLIQVGGTDECGSDAH